MLKGYPKEVTLKDKTTITLRPLNQGDGPALLQMFTEIPAEDRRYLRDDVTDPKLIERWVKNIDEQRVFCLLALVGTRIVGDATLHRSRAGAARHIGEIRIVIDTKHRHRGIGTIMIRELLMAASKWGLEKVIAEVVSEEQMAVKAFRHLGFQEVAVLPGFFKSTNGVNHDKVVLTYSLVTDWDAF